MTGVFHCNYDLLHRVEEPAAPGPFQLGGFIFLCNHGTMQESLQRQLFGLSESYLDSVRSIQPGLPVFLYNYATRQLHGIYEAASFGVSNMDPTAWEDSKRRGKSRYPAQVRIRVRKQCNPLEEDSFRPILHHYDGPKFRLELSVPEEIAKGLDPYHFSMPCRLVVIQAAKMLDLFMEKQLP